MFILKAFLKSIREKNDKITLHKMAIILFVVLSLFNFMNDYFTHIEFIQLNENQILYIYSSLAQVIGALLGLAIAGYSVIDAKIQSIGAEDDTITEYTDNLREDYFHALLLIIVFSVVDIILCLITLAIYDSDNPLAYWLSFFLTEAIVLFLLVMVEVIRFTLYLSPSALKIKGSQEKQNIDNEYSANAELQDNFSAFITYYNLLEQLLKEYACEIVQSYQAAYKMKIFDALGILLQNEIINREAWHLIDAMRRYRNALVHSLDKDKTVNSSIYKELQEMYELIGEIYKNKNDVKIKAEKVSALCEYAKAHTIDEAQK